MGAMEIAYSILILAGSFALVTLGILFLKVATAIKQVGDTIEGTQNTIERADRLMDDVNYKLDLLNTPVESVSRFFDPDRPRFNPVKLISNLLNND